MAKWTKKHVGADIYIKYIVYQSTRQDEFQLKFQIYEQEHNQSLVDNFLSPTRKPVAMIMETSHKEPIHKIWSRIGKGNALCIDNTCAAIYFPKFSARIILNLAVAKPTLAQSLWALFPQKSRAYEHVPMLPFRDNLCLQVIDKNFEYLAQKVYLHIDKTGGADLLWLVNSHKLSLFAMQRGYCNAWWVHHHSLYALQRLCSFHCRLAAAFADYKWQFERVREKIVTQPGDNYMLPVIAAAHSPNYKPYTNFIAMVKALDVAIVEMFVAQDYTQQIAQDFAIRLQSFSAELQKWQAYLDNWDPNQLLANCLKHIDNLYRASLPLQVIERKIWSKLHKLQEIIETHYPQLKKMGQVLPVTTSIAYYLANFPRTATHSATIFTIDDFQVQLKKIAVIPGPINEAPQQLQRQIELVDQHHVEQYSADSQLVNLQYQFGKCHKREFLQLGLRIAGKVKQQCLCKQYVSTPKCYRSIVDLCSYVEHQHLDLPVVAQKAQQNLRAADFWYKNRETAVYHKFIAEWIRGIDQCVYSATASLTGKERAYYEDLLLKFQECLLEDEKNIYIECGHYHQIQRYWHFATRNLASIFVLADPQVVCEIGYPMLSTNLVRNIVMNKKQITSLQFARGVKPNLLAFVDSKCDWEPQLPDLQKIRMAISEKILQQWAPEHQIFSEIAHNFIDSTSFAEYICSQVVQPLNTMYLEKPTAYEQITMWLQKLRQTMEQDGIPLFYPAPKVIGNDYHTSFPRQRPRCREIFSTHDKDRNKIVAVYQYALSIENSCVALSVGKRPEILDTFFQAIIALHNWGCQHPQLVAKGTISPEEFANYFYSVATQHNIHPHKYLDFYGMEISLSQLHQAVFLPEEKVREKLFHFIEFLDTVATIFYPEADQLWMAANTLAQYINSKLSAAIVPENGQHIPDDARAIYYMQTGDSKVVRIRRRVWADSRQQIVILKTHAYQGSDYGYQHQQFLQELRQVFLQVWMLMNREKRTSLRTTICSDWEQQFYFAHESGRADAIRLLLTAFYRHSAHLEKLCGSYKNYERVEKKVLAPLRQWLKNEKNMEMMFVRRNSRYQGIIAERFIDRGVRNAPQAKNTIIRVIQPVFLRNGVRIGEKGIVEVSK